MYNRERIICQDKFMMGMGQLPLWAKQCVGYREISISQNVNPTLCVQLQ